MSVKRSPFYLLLLALLPLFFFLHSSGRAEVFHQAGLVLLRPFHETSRFFSRGIQETAESFRLFWDLYASRAVLLERVQELELEQVQMEELRRENERLTSLLGFRKEIQAKTIAARVIGWDLVPWRQTIVIDKGSRDGMKNRMAVVNAQGLVGRVIEAAPWSARVILLTDAESRVSVIFQESRSVALAQGDGSPWLRLTRLDPTSVVKVGDKVLSSGLGGVYPKGLPLGKVEMVSTHKDSLELMATVRPFVDFSKLEEVLCISSLPSEL